MPSTPKTPLQQFEHSDKSVLPFSEASRLYLDYIRFERGLNKETVYSYASWLHNFEKWLAVNGYPSPTL